MTFCRPVALVLFHCVLHGGPIFFQLPNESHDHVDPAAGRFLGPSFQARNLTMTEDAAKAQHQVPHRGKAGTTALQNLHHLSLLAIQLQFRLAQQRHCYAWCYMPHRSELDCFAGL